MLPQPGEKETSDIEKSKVYITVEIIEYIPNSIVIKTILRKSTGNISVMSFDSGEGLTEKKTPFDTFIQLIDGQAEIIIDGKTQILKTGDAVVIPAHAANTIKPNGRFKIIQTIIKSGYDQV
jgi:quercetin dioxygenase-like cupin family protein